MRALLSLIVSIGLMPSRLSAQVPDNLVTDGISPITPALRQDVERYLEFRTAGFNGWHPVRREMLISDDLGQPREFARRKPGLVFDGNR